MNFLNKMERKFGKYAIPNLSLYLILGYVLGYAMQFVNPAIVDFLTLNPYLILHGQIWRLVTWIIIPPSSLDLLTIVMLMFYYSVGQILSAHGNILLQCLSSYGNALYDNGKLFDYGNQLYPWSPLL